MAERVDLGIATVMARKGQAAALREAVRTAYGVDLPDTSRLVAGPSAGFIGTGPGQWLAVSERLANGELAADLSAKLKGLASISDQSDGRADHSHRWAAGAGRAGQGPAHRPRTRASSVPAVPRPASSP